MQVEKSALVANNDLRVAEIKKLKAEKDSFLNVISEQDHASASDRKHLKEADIYGGLDLGYVDVASNVLRALHAFISR